MAKNKKGHSKKTVPKAADKRPCELIALLVVLGISTLLTAYEWVFYTAHNIVGGSSLPVPVEFLPTYRIILLVTASLQLLMCVLLFLGLKAGFWSAAVFLVLNCLTRLLSLNFSLVGLLFLALYFYFLFCEATRAYFRIGKFKTLGPRHK